MGAFVVLVLVVSAVEQVPLGNVLCEKLAKALKVLDALHLFEQLLLDFLELSRLHSICLLQND